MKRFICFLAVLLLLGCELPNITNSGKSEKFKIGGTTFEYKLPEDWVKLENNTEQGEVLLAQKNDENLIIIQRYIDSENLARELFQQAKKGFFFFKTVNFSETDWVFQGKVSSTKPLREFHQKIFPIKDAGIFLYGSCSYEFSKERHSDCENILSSWKILVDKK